MKKIRLSIGELVERVSDFKHVKLLNDQGMNADDLGISVPTPDGSRFIQGVVKKRCDGVRLIFTNGHTLRCARRHILFGVHGAIHAGDLHPGDQILTKHDTLIVGQVECLSEQDFYDIGLLAPHVYYDAQGILHHNTLLTASLSLLVQPYGRSIVIVPSKNLVVQTEEDYRNLGLDCGVYFGDRKEWGHQHSICTWQSLASLDKQKLIQDFVKDVVCVMTDEVHSAKGKVLRDLLTGAFAHVPIRLGLTGTVPKEEHEAMCLLAAIGPVVGEIRAAELQDKGVLARCQVEVVQLQDDHLGFSDYDSEHEYLVTDPERLVRLAKLMKQWATTGNTLILVDRIEAGETLMKLLPDAVFIHGTTKLNKRQEEYKSIQEADEKIIIATYGVASVGINIPRIFNLVLLEPGKSFVRVIQSIGRGLRRAKDKDYIRIIDLCSSMKFSKRHLTKRKSFYNEQDYPHTMTKIRY